MMATKDMTPKGLNTMRRTLLITALAFAVLNLSTAQAQSQPEAGSITQPIAQMTFSTPQAAVDALIQALSDYDVPQLMKIFGPEGEQIVASKDPVRDKNLGIALCEPRPSEDIDTARSREPKATDSCSR